MKKAWRLLSETIDEFSAVPTLSLSAATAYYAAFSIGPLLVLAMWLAGLAMGREHARQEITRQLQSFIGGSSTQLVDSMMNAQIKTGNLSVAVIGGLALVFGATGVFSQLQTSLNIIWGITSKPGHSIWLMVRDRLLSLAMILAIGFLLLVSMVLTAVVNGFSHRIGQLISLPTWVAPVFEAIVSFVVVAMLFALIFKVLPDVKLRWRDVGMGAVGASVLFTIGKILLGIYLAHEMSVSAYGLGSAFIVVLLYVYYASLIMYLGAEFTMVYARHSGCHLELSEYAQPLPGRDPCRAASASEPSASDQEEEKKRAA